jgi:hypothetical protein
MTIARRSRGTGRRTVPRHHHKLRRGNRVDDTYAPIIPTPRSLSIYVGRRDGVCGIGWDSQTRTARGADILSAGDIARGAGTIRGEFAGEDNVFHVRRNRRRAGIV